MLSLGIDPSTAATGLVLLSEINFTPLLECEIKPKASLKGMARLEFITHEIMKTIHANKPDVIAIEGYSLNTKHASSIIPLVELGGLLRFFLYLDGFEWLSPRASTLKKFVTGSGTAKKDEVMMHVLKRWGHTSQSNNTADAYVLAAMGLAAKGGLTGITKVQTEIINGLPFDKH